MRVSAAAAAGAAAAGAAAGAAAPPPAAPERAGRRRRRRARRPRSRRLARGARPARRRAASRPRGRDTKDLLSRVELASAAEGARASLMCLIYTIEKSHPAARGVRDTWASHCDGWATMSTATDADIPAVNVPHDGPEEYNNIWQKIRAVWRYVLRNYGDDFEWFVIGGDDLFVIAENLKAYLGSDEIVGAARDGANPLFLGRRFQIPGGQLFN